MQKITAIWALFRQGQSVADPKLWKERQITATTLGGVFLAAVHVLQAFGVNVPLDTEAATALAGGVVVLVNLVLTLVTTDKVGLPPKPEADSSPLP